jgi:SAM-dependent methyltransferase
MARADRERWTARHRRGELRPGSPSAFLVEHAGLIRGQFALDVACGPGRHALWLARHGLHVHAIDISEPAARALAHAARATRLPVAPVVADLESFPLPASTYDVVVNVNFLYRPLLPCLAAALRPRGLLVFETFLRHEASHGGPHDPAYLLAPGELRERFAGILDLLEYREGPAEHDGRLAHVASLIARRP